MSVSVNTSLTAATRNALEANLAEATRASIAMSTGEAITHAYEDPTGFSIGSNLRSQRDILSVVKTGIDQSSSMLYIAEASLKSYSDTVDQLETVLARAKLGYMTDELVLTTLSQTYIQMKEELNRIAASSNFNGQNLLNGTGGIVKAGTPSTVDNSLRTFDMSGAISGLQPYATNDNPIIGLSGTTTNTSGMTKTGDLTVSTSSPNVTPIVSGGTLVQNGADFVLSNATLTVRGVTVKDSANPANTGTADLIINGVTLTFANATFNEGVLTATAAPTVSDINASNVSFQSIIPATINGITAISSISGASPAMTFVAGNATISNIGSIYQSTGGISTTSIFKFVTGTDLAHDVIEVSLPNLSLLQSPGVPNVISCLNVSGLTTSTMPSSLTNLTSIADADRDIPIVAALREQVVTFINALGAYQLRFINLSKELNTSVEQLDNAQGAILNADLPKNAEAAARAKVNVNIAIQSLNDLNAMLTSLQRIVTG